MKENTRQKNQNVKSEYTVEFACHASFLVGFEEATGLTDRQIVAKALQIANVAFENGGTFLTEKQHKNGFYSITAYGVDSRTANIVGKPLPTIRPQLRVVK